MNFIKILIAVIAVVSFLGCGGDSSSNDSNNTHVTTLSQANSDDNKQNDTQAVFSKGEFGEIVLNSNYDMVKKDLNNALLIDVRTPWEREHYGYPEGFTNNIVYEEREYDKNGHHQANPPVSQTFISDIDKLTAGDKNKKIVLICASSSRTSRAAKLLSENGFTNVWHIKGGYGQWNDKDFPIVKN
jgi:rhodanese-related sulfurtransferase